MPQTDDEKAKQNEYNQTMGVLRNEISRLELERNKLRAASKLAELDTLFSGVGESSKRVTENKDYATAAKGNSEKENAQPNPRPSMAGLLAGGGIGGLKKVTATLKPSPVSAASSVSHENINSADPAALSIKERAAMIKGIKPKGDSNNKPKTLPQNSADRANNIDKLKGNIVKLMAEINLLKDEEFVKKATETSINELRNQQQTLKVEQEKVTAIYSELETVNAELLGDGNKKAPAKEVRNAGLLGAIKGGVKLNAAADQNDDIASAAAENLTPKQKMAAELKAKTYKKSIHNLHNEARSMQPSEYVDGSGVALLKKLTKQQQIYFPDTAEKLARRKYEFKQKEYNIAKKFEKDMYALLAIELYPNELGGKDIAAALKVIDAEKYNEAGSIFEKYKAALANLEKDRVRLAKEEMAIVEAERAQHSKVDQQAKLANLGITFNVSADVEKNVREAYEADLENKRKTIKDGAVKAATTLSKVKVVKTKELEEKKQELAVKQGKAAVKTAVPDTPEHKEVKTDFLDDILDEIEEDEDLERIEQIREEMRAKNNSQPIKPVTTGTKDLVKPHPVTVKRNSLLSSNKHAVNKETHKGILRVLDQKYQAMFRLILTESSKLLEKLERVAQNRQDKVFLGLLRTCKEQLALHAKNDGKLTADDAKDVRKLLKDLQPEIPPYAKGGQHGKHKTDNYIDMLSALLKRLAELISLCANKVKTTMKRTSI